MRACFAKHSRLRGKKTFADFFKNADCVKNTRYFCVLCNKGWSYRDNHNPKSTGLPENTSLSGGRRVLPEGVGLSGGTSLETARLAVAVPKRNIRLAVTRNRLKRLVRESFRKNQQNFQGHDVVVVVKKNFDGKMHNILGKITLSQKKTILQKNDEDKGQA